MKTHAYNPSTWDVETGRSVQAHLLLHLSLRFKASPGYIRPCLKKANRQKQRETESEMEKARHTEKDRKRYRETEMAESHCVAEGRFEPVVSSEPPASTSQVARIVGT